MKIKTGFVSNSSSASFICTIGRIADEEKFNAFIKENKIEFDSHDSRIIDGETALGKVGLIPTTPVYIWGDFYDQIDINLLVESAKRNPDSNFVVSSGYGPGEFDVYDEDDNWIETDYSTIELSDFDLKDQLLYKSSPDVNGIEVIQQTFYAGRNG